MLHLSEVSEAVTTMSARELNSGKWVIKSSVSTSDGVTFSFLIFQRVFSHNRSGKQTFNNGIL